MHSFEKKINYIGRIKGVYLNFILKNKINFNFYIINNIFLLKKDAFTLFCIRCCYYSNKNYVEFNKEIIDVAQLG